MTDRQRRLQRLVNALGDMVRSLEAVLVQKKSRAVALQDAMAEIDRLATVACASNPASLPAILRSLTARDMELKQVLEEIGGLRQRLLSARAGEKMATSAFKRVRDSAERKSVEDQALEAACTVRTKASGKGRVVT